MHLIFLAWVFLTLEKFTQKRTEFYRSNYYPYTCHNTQTYLCEHFPFSVQINDLPFERSQMHININICVFRYEGIEDTDVR